MIVKLRAQKRSQRRQGAGGDPLQRRQVGRQRHLEGGKRRPGDRRFVLVLALDHAGVGKDEVAPVRADGAMRRRLGAQIGQQADLAQQHELERPQRRLRRRVVAGREGRDGGAVGVEQQGVRVVAGEQLHEQLVQIEAAEERGPAQHRLAACPVGGAQRVHLARVVARRQATERHLQALERQQYAAQLREGALGALRRDRDSALLAREKIENEARLTPVVVMEHVGRERRMASGTAGHVRSGAGRLEGPRGYS